MADASKLIQFRQQATVTPIAPPTLTPVVAPTLAPPTLQVQPSQPATNDRDRPPTLIPQLSPQHVPMQPLSISKPVADPPPPLLPIQKGTQYDFINCVTPKVGWGLSVILYSATL